MAKTKKDEVPEEKPIAAEDVDVTQEAQEAQSEEVPSCEEIKAALDAEKDKLLRLAAEYDNYRKRSSKERETLFNDIRADTIAEFLPVYDNLERALKQECSDEAFYKGVEMTMTQFKEILGKLGVKEIAAVGKTFNPDQHNAVMHVEDPEYGETVVVEEFQKGFILGDKVIRFSMVKVAN